MWRQQRRKALTAGSRAAPDPSDLLGREGLADLVDLGGPVVDLAPVQVHQSKRLAPKTLHTLGGPGGPRPPKWHRRPPLPRTAGRNNPNPLRKRGQALYARQVHQGAINFLPGKHFEVVNLAGVQVHQGPPRSTSPDSTAHAGCLLRRAVPSLAPCGSKEALFAAGPASAPDEQHRGDESRGRPASDRRRMWHLRRTGG
jgi:hypothetical protein